MSQEACRLHDRNAPTPTPAAETGRRAHRPPRWRRKVARVLTFAVWIAVAVLATRHILDGWRSVDPGAVPVPTAILAFGLLVAARATDVLGWHRLLRGAGASTPLRTASRVYLTSELVRYLPGGVLHFAARYRYATRLGVTPTAVVATTAVDLALRLVSALIVFALTISLWPRLPGAYTLLTAAAIPVLLVSSHPRVLARLLARAQRRLRQVETPLVLPYATLVRASGWYLMGWLARGVVTWLLVCSFVASERSSWLPLAGATSLSWVVGVLTPVAPGGIGAREASGAALLHPFLPLDMALGVMLIVRLATTVAEVAAAGAAVVADHRPHLCRATRREPTGELPRSEGDDRGDPVDGGAHPATIRPRGGPRRAAIRHLPAEPERSAL